MTKIFLETGKPKTAEYVFVKTLVHKLGFKDEIFELECVDGKDNLRNVVNQLKDNTLNGGENLIIFDADSPLNGGGFAPRREQIVTVLKDNGIEAELFLFPDNSSDGDFETLLLSLARKDLNKKFFDCFADYEKCLGDQYVSPNLKGKIYTYISAQKGLTKAQRDKLGGGEWQFDNPSIWDLESDALTPLKEFLKANL